MAKLETDKFAFVAPDSGSIMNNDFLAMHLGRYLRDKGLSPIIETGYVKKVRVDDSETPRIRTVEGIDDLTGRTVIMNDDETLSGKSLVQCAELAMERGAKDVYAFVTHGILSGSAVSRIEESPLTKLFVTDTVEFNKEEAEKVVGGQLTKIETLSVARIFAEAIKRTHEGKSLSSLFLGK